MGNTTSQNKLMSAWDINVTLTKGNVQIFYKMTSDSQLMVKKVTGSGAELTFTVDPTNSTLTQNGAGAGTDGDIEDLRKAVIDMQETVNKLLGLEDDEAEECEEVETTVIEEETVEETVEEEENGEEKEEVHTDVE